MAQNQNELPGMPAVPPPDPPTMKNMAKVMQMIDQLYPADTHGATGQWERLIEVSDTLFRGSVRFVIPAWDYAEVADAREYGDKVVD